MCNIQRILSVNMHWMRRISGHGYRFNFAGSFRWAHEKWARQGDNYPVLFLPYRSSFWSMFLVCHFMQIFCASSTRQIVVSLRVINERRLQIQQLVREIEREILNRQKSFIGGRVFCKDWSETRERDKNLLRGQGGVFLRAESFQTGRVRMTLRPELGYL